MRLRTIGRSSKTPSKRNRKNSPRKLSGNTAPVDSRYIVEEINAYIAIRDMRIAAAEQAPTAESLRQATLANEFVETCLERPQVIYAAQHLPEPYAAFERKRCAAVSARIAELRLTAR